MLQLFPDVGTAPPPPPPPSLSLHETRTWNSLGSNLPRYITTSPGVTATSRLQPSLCLSWTHVGQWMYNSTYSFLGTTWQWAVNFTLRLFYPPTVPTWCVQVLRSPKEAFAAAMQWWRERCEKCVCLQGDYVEKWLHFQLPVVSSFLK